MRIVCWQTILMTYHTLFFFRKLGKLPYLSSAAVVINALRVKYGLRRFGLRRFHYKSIYSCLFETIIVLNNTAPIVQPAKSDSDIMLCL